MGPDTDVRAATLDTLCSRLRNGSQTGISLRSLIETLESRGYDERAVREAVEQLDEQRAVDYQRAIGEEETVTLVHRGVEEYESTSGETVIPGGNVIEILATLGSQERVNPQAKRVSRQELLTETSLSPSELDAAVWYMRERGQIDVCTNAGADSWWVAAETTNGGHRSPTQIR